MVNPSAFQGTHKDFLLSQKAAYMAGVAGRYAADALADIQHRYFKHYLIDLPHSDEPSAEWLAMVEDDTPDVEREEPDISTLDEEQHATVMKQLEERRALYMFCKSVNQSLLFGCCLLTVTLLSKSNIGLHTNT